MLFMKLFTNLAFCHNRVAGCLPLGEHMVSVVRYMTWLRTTEVLHSGRTTAKALWSVSADVREMLDRHSTTKTDGLKKREQLNMSPSPGGGALHLLHAWQKEAKSGGQGAARESVSTQGRRANGTKLNRLKTIVSEAAFCYTSLLLQSCKWVDM